MARRLTIGNVTITDEGKVFALTLNTVHGSKPCAIYTADGLRKLATVLNEFAGAKRKPLPDDLDPEDIL